ncbi:ABC transporter substrate-binding protein [Nitrosopumilus adriaticus]|uniref:Putative ABC transporter substrate binding protein n=1 Tax=Nitrosopumilus adriaticus TaxID=1580092 RepID=A0A0D5C4J7_9ARCH|nr:ABC transporter substrate-binding protein [Nitrosopumilus adriaticus]AJW71292.1 putative ABC transporter substrate binding protein [Nitrosopumilus adriaticus]
MSQTEILDFEINSEEKIIIGVSKWIENDDQNLNVLSFKKQITDWNISGKEIEFIVKSARGSQERQQEIIQEYVDTKIDLIYTLTTPGTLIAKKITSDIPIVFSVVTYPVEAKIINSLENSGNNLVGVRNYVPMTKQFELISDTLSIKTIGFIHRQGEVNSEIQLNEAIPVADDLGIQVIDIAANSISNTSELLSENIGDLDAIYLACDTLIQSGADVVAIKIATENSVPVFTCNLDAIKKGAMMGNVADISGLGKIAGEKATYILQGTKPTNLVTETQRIPLIVINLPVAETLDIEIPQKTLEKASIIIQ